MRLTSEEIIIPELAVGEEIRWIGMSSLRTVLPRGLLLILIGLVFALAPYFSADHNENGLKILVWAVFLYVGLRTSHGGLISILAYRNTVFAVTDRRALTVRKFLGISVKSFPPGSVNILDYHIKADGSGSIAFQAQEVAGLDASSVEKIGFQGVQDVAGARRALMKLHVQYKE